MATKLTFSGSDFHTSQRVEVKDGQVRPAKGAVPIKTSTLSPKEQNNGKG